MSLAAQELRAEEDRIYAEWMRAAEGAAREARMAYHERRRQQLLQVRALPARPAGIAGCRAAGSGVPALAPRCWLPQM